MKPNCTPNKIVLPGSEHTVSLSRRWWKYMGRSLGLRWRDLAPMLKGEAPYYRILNTKLGPIPVHVMRPEDVTSEVCSYAQCMGVCFIDLALNYLYGRRSCPELRCKNGLPRDPQKVLPPRVRPGDCLRFSIGKLILTVRFLPFEENKLSRLSVLIPRGMTLKKLIAESSNRRLRVVCERRYSNIARGFLQKLNVNYILRQVSGKVEGFVSGGDNLAIDVVSSGRSATENGLRPAASITKGYPVLLNRIK